MKCKKCGCELGISNQFCSHCGTKCEDKEKSIMNRLLLTLFIVTGFSFADSLQSLQKQCFEDGYASFAYKTKDKIILYGDKKNPKIFFVKYSVRNNPSMNEGYPDESFYLIDLPKEIISAFSVKKWNDYLCGVFYPYAYPNTNEQTSIQTQEDASQVSYNDKYFFFRELDPNNAIVSPESMDSFSVSIPGNAAYNALYPISKIYPVDYVEKYDRKKIETNKVFVDFIDNLIKLSKIKDFEARKKVVKELKEKEASLVDAIEEFNNYVDEYNDTKNVNQKINVYKDVDKYLSEMDYKFSNAKKLLTRNSEAFAEAVHIFYKNFDKEASRYLRKIKEKKNKETEKALMEYSEETLKNAVGMIQRGIERLGNSGNVNDRQIAYLLNDYESEYTSYLDKIKSGDHGSIKQAKMALGKILRLHTYIFDFKGKTLSYPSKKDEEDDNIVVSLDDGTDLVLYGGTKKGDHRILIRMKNGASSIRSLVFDETGKEFQSAFVSTEYVYQKYLPPLQIVYSGDANTFTAIDEKTNLLNQSTFPEVSQFSMPDDIEKREKIKCIFEAIDGDMKTLKELVGARLINHHGSMILREKNNKLDKISCKDGKILSR